MNEREEGEIEYDWASAHSLKTKCAKLWGRLMLKSDNYSTHTHSVSLKRSGTWTNGDKGQMSGECPQNKIISQSHTNYTVPNSFVFNWTNFYSINHLWFRFDETSSFAAWVISLSLGSQNAIDGAEMNTAIIFTWFYRLLCYDNNDIIWFYNDYDDDNDEQSNVKKINCFAIMEALKVSNWLMGSQLLCFALACNEKNSNEIITLWRF